MTATIKVSESGRVGQIRFDVPVFIGATGDTEKGMFPEVGSTMPIFGFHPVQYETGTLVFDCVYPPTRTPLSAVFYHYWWKDDKLIVKDGLRSGCLKWGYSRSDTAGYSTRIDDGGATRDYYTGTTEPSWPNSHKVTIIDLLLFLEGKITEAQLKELVIKG